MSLGRTERYWRTILPYEGNRFICSLDPDRIRDGDLQRLIRDHWQVENCLARISSNAS